MHGVLSLYGRIPASSKETSGLLTQTQFVYWLQRHVLRKAGRIRTLLIDGIDMLQPFRRPCFPNNGIGTGIVAEHNLDNSVSASLHCRHDDVIKWKHFPRYWSFVQGIHRSPVNSPHKGQWRGALMFSLICTLNKQLSKQSWGWWFEMPSRSLWRHCNG